MTTTTTATKRQTQKGVARAATARKRVDSNAAKVTAINAAQAQVEDAIKGVLTGTMSESDARKQIDAAARVAEMNTNRAAGRKGALSRQRKAGDDAIAAIVTEGTLTPRKRAPRKTLVMTDKGTTLVVEPAKKAAAKSTKTAAKTTAAKSTKTKKAAAKTEATELRDTLHGAAVDNADKIMSAASRLQSAEGALLADGIDARNPATKDSTPAHKERDAAVKELIKLDAGWTFIARARGVASSTNRGFCRVLMGGKRI